MSKLLFVGKPEHITAKESGKIYKIDDHVMVGVSGVIADANYLVKYTRLTCQRHKYSHHEPMYVQEVAKFVANEKHYYT